MTGCRGARIKDHGSFRFHLPVDINERPADPDAPEDEYEGVICPACTRLHFVNRKTGRLLGQDEE